MLLVSGDGEFELFVTKEEFVTFVVKKCSVAPQPAASRVAAGQIVHLAPQNWGTTAGKAAECNNQTSGLTTAASGQSGHQEDADCSTLSAEEEARLRAKDRKRRGSKDRGHSWRQGQNWESLKAASPEGNSEVVAEVPLTDGEASLTQMLVDRDTEIIRLTNQLEARESDLRSQTHRLTDLKQQLRFTEATAATQQQSGNIAATTAATQQQASGLDQEWLECQNDELQMELTTAYSSVETLNLQLQQVSLTNDKLKQENEILNKEITDLLAQISDSNAGPWDNTAELPQTPLSNLTQPAVFAPPKHAPTWGLLASKRQSEPVMAQQRLSSLSVDSQYQKADDESDGTPPQLRSSHHDSELNGANSTIPSAPETDSEEADDSWMNPHSTSTLTFDDY